MFSVLLPVDHPVYTAPPRFGELTLSSDPNYYAEVNFLDAAAEDNLAVFVPDYWVFLSADELTFKAELDVEQVLTVTINQAVYSLHYLPVIISTEDYNLRYLPLYTGGQAYDFGDLPLAVGEFTYDPDTLDVVVKMPLIISSSNLVISYKGSKKQRSLPVVTSPDFPVALATIPSTKICRAIEPSLARWNVQENITIQRTFGDHSSFSFSFTACKIHQDSIAGALSNGSELTAFGDRWVIDSLAITLIKDSDQIAVTVSLKNWLASRGNPSKSPLDVHTKLKKLDSSVRTISEFANGVGYRGAAINARVPRQTGSEETTTLRELLETRAITTHGFVFYGLNGVEIRDWGRTRLHVINEADVREEFTYKYAGHGNYLDGVQLHTEYRNIQVGLDFDPDTADKKQGVTERWVFENCRDLQDLYSAREDRGFYYQSPSPDVLRNPGVNFDAGGVVKKATRIIELNGTTTFEQTIEAGYAFSSAEVYRIEVTAQGNYIIHFDDPDPQSFWQVVRTTTTDHIFDKDGYLKASRTTGRELVRLQQESEKLEAVNLQAQAIINPVDDGGISRPDPSLQAQADAYKFDKYLPVIDTTTFQIAPLASYFEDTVKPSDRCDPDFVEPKFLALKTRNSQGSIVQPNPKNNEEFTYPAVVRSKFLTETERNTITSTKHPSSFENRTSAQNSEGEYAKNTIALGNTTQNTGKPSVHVRLDNKLDPVNNGDNGNRDRYGNENYYLNSPGVTPGAARFGYESSHPKAAAIKTNEGSKSYPDIDSPDTVRAIAETELSIINTQNALTTTIDIHWRGGVEEGDRVLFRGRIWVIFGIQDSRKIEHGAFNSTSFQLSLGRLLKPRVNLENRNQC